MVHDGVTPRSSFDRNRDLQTFAQPVHIVKLFFYLLVGVLLC
jgi:hypothetical protein